MIEGRVTYRAVFFDAGETLLHPHPSFAELFSEVLRSEGIEPAPDPGRIDTILVSDRFAKAAADGELWTTSPERSRRFWLSIYETFLEGLGLASHDRLPERLYERFTDLASYTLFPDVHSCLSRLKATGLMLGLVSNFEAWLEELLEALGVSGFFDVRVISGLEGVEKPDPRIFGVALDRAGLSAGEVVYVGDNPVFDTEPAEGLGMFGVLIDRRGRFMDHSGVRIESLDDLPLAIGLPFA